MIQLLLDGVYRDLELIHVRMNLSQEMDSAGRFRIAKVLELIRVVAGIYRAKIKYRPRAFYYAPSGPCLLTVMRDLVILGSTRWLFGMTVFHFHASGLSEFTKTMNPLLRKLYQIVFAHPDLAIHISGNVPKEGLSLGCKQERVIANGIPDSAGEYIIRSTAANARINVLFVNQLREDKGILVAIRAALELMKEGADIELTCVGMWQSDELQARALTLIEPPLRSRFNFPGVVVGAPKWQYYRKADIVLLPSFFHSETFPVVLLEAMCFSLPVVASRWRGIPDVVEEGSCAILCEPKDVTSCRDALAQIIKDPVLRDNMGRKARERYLRNFTIDAYRKAMESALSQLAG